MRRISALMVMVALLAAGCGGGTKKSNPPAAQPDATVSLQEYAFVTTGAMKAGGTLRVQNVGKEFHMIGLGKLKAGKTLADAKAALESDGEEDDAATLEEVGMPGSFFGPGTRADITVPTFAAGKYAMVCFINVEGQQEPHFARGMINEIDVGTQQGKTPTADATYSVSSGKAVTGPATLKAGRRTLKIERDAAGGVLEPALVKLNAGTTLEQFAAALKAFEEGPLPVGAASKIPGQLLFNMFDYEGATVVYVALDLSAGTYVLAAQDTDVENAPDVPVERIEITVS